MKAQIITRGDDLGSFRTANTAIRDAFNDGILHNTSVMVPTGFIEEAAELLKGETELCFGLHLTVTSEWENVRWRPLCDPKDVPCLVNDDGTFCRNPMGIHENGTVLEQVMNECRAQLNRARELGFEIEYVDEHMGFGWLFEGDDESVKVQDLLNDWCREEGLVYFRNVACERLPKVEGEFDSRIDQYLAQLDACEPGKTYLVVGHPAYPTDEMAQVHHASEEPGQHGFNRDQQRLMFMEPRVLERFQERLTAISYTQAPVG